MCCWEQLSRFWITWVTLTEPRFLNHHESWFKPMLILAADTSGKNGSLALVQFTDESSQVLEIVSLEGGNFSAQLVPQISGLLEKQKLAKSAIDGFAVASGPGSFTGLRVG